jgi:putative oxidoreductase
MNALATTTARNSTTAVSVDQRKEPAVNLVQKVSDLTARVLLSTLFLLSGLGKLGAYAATAAYMSSLGVPGALLPVVIATEIGGALAIILGWKTRIAAALLAGFTLLAAFIFHSRLSDQIQMIMFLKNVSIVGGLLLLVVNGAGPLSVDRRKPR